MKMEWGPIILTFKLAAICTMLLLFIGIPLAYWLATTQSRFKSLVETLTAMPLVLPPTVLGFYLLVTFSPNNFLGGWLRDTFNVSLIFSFGGLVIGSIIYSLPFMVQPIQAGFQHLPKSLYETATLMGKSKWSILSKVLIPNIKSSILTGIVLSFAHTIGEFGVVLMIGGNIPERTKVASIAIYDAVEMMDYNLANKYAGFLFVVTFIILLLLYRITGRNLNKVM